MFRLYGKIKNLFHSSLSLKKLIIPTNWAQVLNKANEIVRNRNLTIEELSDKIEQLEKGYEYTFYNATGHLLKKQNIREKTTQIDASTLPKGIYLLSVKKDNQIIKTFKIIKKEN